MTKELLRIVKDLADEQFYPAVESGDYDDCVGFDFNGQFIIHPWMDETGRYVLPTEQAMALYGKENFALFCRRILWAKADINAYAKYMDGKQD